MPYKLTSNRSPAPISRLGDEEVFPAATVVVSGADAGACRRTSDEPTRSWPRQWAVGRAKRTSAPREKDLNFMTTSIYQNKQRKALPGRFNPHCCAKTTSHSTIDGPFIGICVLPDKNKSLISSARFLVNRYRAWNSECQRQAVHRAQ